MPRKNSLFSPTPIVAAQSLASSFNSNYTTVSFLDNVMIQIVGTGTPVGTFAVQTSLDLNPQDSTYTPTWTSLDLSGTPAFTGTGDTILITLNQLPSPYIRLAYTASSGAGTVNAWVSAKEI